MIKELLFVKKVTHAFIPFRGSSEAAGFDLLSCHSVDILAGTTGCINTGIQVVLPKNTYGRIADRSSMAIKSLAVLGRNILTFIYHCHFSFTIICISISFEGGVIDRTTRAAS
ncbi:Deoxyuridine 5'-triphosphate nucleotidohydrolase [Orchesella cincta]|uniref:dUTP diphosphatase n=1 Tax=Orchesella cincta TaxID=48709 RepID=A0A1D2M7P8_ORCCI|nr:Deoxyuridine 5'-triphosphate nucleotidohydrolase [Orchesella cincta]